MRVCVVQPVLKRYREPFFQQLATSLAADSIKLTVQYGRPWPQEALRGDNVTIGPPLGVETANWQLGAGLMLQPAVRPWWGADLVVVEHANKHALNYVLALLKHRAFGQFAYWGHGLDRQGDCASRSERFKRRSLHWADWWFAYTAGATRYVAEQGFAADRITTVENAVDTSALRLEIAGIDAKTRLQHRADRGWDPGAKIGVYCGSLYGNKRLDLLVEAGLRIHAALPEFRLLVVGGGPQAEWMAAAAQTHAGWLRYEGPRFGADKAACLAVADVCLNPGLVGLGILDAFCAGLPMITTDVPYHSPEIEYLEAGRNGLITAVEPAAYAAAVLQVLSDVTLLGALRSGAEVSARRFSIETMVSNFAAGVRQCLRR